MIDEAIVEAGRLVVRPGEEPEWTDFERARDRNFQPLEVYKGVEIDYKPHLEAADTVKGRSEIIRATNREIDYFLAENTGANGLDRVMVSCSRSSRVRFG